MWGGGALSPTVVSDGGPHCNKVSKAEGGGAKAGGWGQGHGADRTVLPTAPHSKSHLGLRSIELKNPVEHLELGRKEPQDT